MFPGVRPVVAARRLALVHHDSVEMVRGVVHDRVTVHGLQGGLRGCYAGA